MEQWTAVVLQALDSGEIESTSDARDIVQRFHYRYTSMAFEQSLHNGLDFEVLQKAYQAHYDSLHKHLLDANFIKCKISLHLM